MKADRERCFAAGMDEYVTQPVQADDLDDALDAVLAGAPAPPRPAKPKATPLDRTALLDRVSHSVEFLRELTDVYHEETPQVLGAVREAIARGDAPRLKVAAHTLKGAVSNFGTAAAVEAAQRLELLGQAGSLVAAAEVVPRLEDALSEFEPALDELLVELSPRRP